MESLISLTPLEAETVGALFDRLFPADESGPGATAIGAVTYLDRALGGWLRDDLPTYRTGLANINGSACSMFDVPFANASADEQDMVIWMLEAGTLPGLTVNQQKPFFALLLAHCQEGLFADPIYGGNRDKLGWKTLDHPGISLSNTAEENLATEPVSKGGQFRSLGDVRDDLRAQTIPDPEMPNFDPRKSTEPPAGPVDVVLVGVGAVGGLIAPILARAGLHVVGLEAGPVRSLSEFVPDELGATYYCRQNLGPKFMAEQPRWRTDESEPTQEPTYSLGRMMNNAGGSVIHYGAWLRRFHPHQFRYRSHIEERWGRAAIPDECTAADWPISYDDLEPYFTKLDHEIGIAGDDQNIFLQRSNGYPLPPTRPFRLGNLFTETTRAMGLHPHPVPVGYNTEPYNGFPAASYTAWDNGFGSWSGSKWHPGLTAIPAALATGNFELRTNCRVTKLLTNANGRAVGVEYIDQEGTVHEQLASTVILSSYTWENIRLMFLSGNDSHPDGLGNDTGQLGKHLMIKMFTHVGGLFPDQIFNRHTGPAAQGVVLDDFMAEPFDSWTEGGFLGGVTLGAENQFLPIQIARESLPAGVPRWGAGYRRHLRNWQHLGVVRAQPEALSYATNYVDIDPRHRDKSGLGLPVVRVTYDLRNNERRIADFVHLKADEILRAMGASETWNGPDFTGIGSSHDLGGTRMSDDPRAGVVDRDLKVHGMDGLFVFSGSAFPTCPGINPTLTLWAVAYRAAERLVATLKGSKNDE